MVMSRRSVDQHAACAAPALTRERSGVRTVLPVAGLPRRSRDELLLAARHGLDEASLAQLPGQRYALAHMAALRAAAAVLADRAQARPGHRGRPVSVWRLLATVAPELAEWAQFFAAGAARRAAAEAGLPVVGTRDADDLARQVEIFLTTVETTLGLPSQAALPAMVVGPVRSSRD
ncbi:SAV_6107 family HEPN domain-containing protein [Frankia sp. CiP3]|uniref:SAV_6107 family HEPN domain-containing protein n=1 Tax=Frankia sp. CiP3 TaxID=2880971 RepID=UPI001EF738D7